ncbi:phosphatidylserine decarboxylase Psd1 [Schizosaccharomyces cryophilus OY26]|uniref:Phosphatidylserine decarboxylase proenzyme 1, mitochondrial n=1 Tax=Schizosaccharomyces cryophilus (strain OY26 / ATCC MYA-4695 / CBS 11777 / NBRC 106824 / NRRL Y48691) TaxID=653667 RepID=S9W8F1_SCHCR|nr:phosphatidylserine decarboxylase Psd1 [Schizosaccharomyces cryophilus OY26]EPY54110.1 phosphatidylserine decarboxylase Psd1 [Schizosaccharomyces cryophilus OY26]
MLHPHKIPRFPIKQLNSARPFFTNAQLRKKRKFLSLGLSSAGLGLAGLAGYAWNQDRHEKKPTKTGVNVEGPWHFYVLSTLPLRTLSRWWGYVNRVEIPVSLRNPGFRLYSWLFDCDLKEAEIQDLKEYHNLAEFFTRRLKPESRPIDPEALLVSPADGKVLNYGVIKGGHLEQVKGLTYSLEALLGQEHLARLQKAHAIPSPEHIPHISQEEFALVNGIEYSLQDLMGHNNGLSQNSVKDASVNQVDLVNSTKVAMRSTFDFMRSRDQNLLYYAVIYLAPGNYHRFHSPTDWVVERRRHFSGELFSVSPYMVSRLGNLFVLNERVAMLGRYKYGFMSMIPVGATNVGSIRINFDKDLCTNQFGLLGPTGTYDEAVYTKSSAILHGHPLLRGEEIGNFELGSTIVLVFEAPANFQFNIQRGQVVKVGQSLGNLESTA